MRTQEALIKQETLIIAIADLIIDQLEEDFPRGSCHYKSMVQLYSQEDGLGPSIVIYDLRLTWRYSRFSQDEMQYACNMFF